MLRILHCCLRAYGSLQAIKIYLRPLHQALGALHTDDKNGNVDVGGLGRGVLVVVAVVRHFILTRAASKDMPKIREVLSLAHYFKYLSDEEFILLYDINKQGILTFLVEVNISISMICATLSVKQISGSTETTSTG